MRKIILAVIVLISLSRYPVDARTAVGDLEIVVQGVKNDKGLVHVALCSDKDQYYHDRDLFRAVKIKPVKPATRYVFKEIPYGLYALKVYHDENSNDKLDTGIFGIPREDYGFSNDPGTGRGMPSYEKTAFEFSPDSKAITIRMK